MWLVYNEPDLHGQNHRVYITKADAIKQRKEYCVSRGWEEPSDDVALYDFKVINWAWEMADEPR
jgi:hypothetical protein